MALDEGDRRLLDILARDGRAAAGELAEAVGLSASSVRRRIAELRASGVLYFDVKSPRRACGECGPALAGVDSSRLAEAGASVAPRTPRWRSPPDHRARRQPLRHIVDLPSAALAPLPRRVGRRPAGPAPHGDHCHPPHPQGPGALPAGQRGGVPARKEGAASRGDAPGPRGGGTSNSGQIPAGSGRWRGRPPALASGPRGGARRVGERSQGSGSGADRRQRHARDPSPKTGTYAMAAHTARRLPLRTLILTVVAALAGAMLWMTGGAAPAHAAAQTWSDEFNGAAGSAPDAAKWTHGDRRFGNGNNELEYYTNSTRNAALDGNGNLVITARREPDGGLPVLVRNLPVHLGPAAHHRHVHPGVRPVRGPHQDPARARACGRRSGCSATTSAAPAGPTAARSTSWRTSARSPAPCTARCTAPATPAATASARLHRCRRPGLADAFHTFAVDWAPNSITWYVDGVAY